MKRSPLRLVEGQPEATFPVTFDGGTLDALPGQTIAAVLWSAGIRSWRTTRVEQRPRGVFCGIGVCFDCLVTVNGVPNQRACSVTARVGDVITTQRGDGHDAA
ncbi:MAG TPA: (2Fe-2S)-binding protein [Actinospica sp.]|nr:(2Fe-2S)-binding protein [Actinospica sp.]